MRSHLVEMRRDFYSHPELSRDEARTADVVARHLRRLGLSVEREIGGHGVVGLLQGARPGPVVAFRADMDALPMRDTLEAPYQSFTLGVKHACGHDVHMAVALGAADLLAELRERLPGTVKFIFQPAEESLEGARAMIDAGVLKNPRPEAIFALHALPIPVGRVAVTPGIALAGMDEFKVRFYSPAGHLDLLITRAAAALRELSTATAPSGAATFDLLMRSLTVSDKHRRSILVSCWPYTADASLEHHLMGLVSLPDPDLRAVVHRQLWQTLDRITSEMGATYDLLYTHFNPQVHNDLQLLQAVRPAVTEVVGVDNFLVLKSPYPFAHEDFALYQHEVPGVLFWLGTANAEKGITSILHQPDFDVDEDALLVGTRLAASLLLHYLGRNAP